MPGKMRTWLFDLDNTLHNASAQVFPHINRSMTAYIGRHLNLDEAEATRLRQNYWQRYGATLLGLMRHHDTDPRHFLHHTHQFPDLPGMIVAERGLKAMLGRQLWEGAVHWGWWRERVKEMRGHADVK